MIVGGEPDQDKADLPVTRSELFLVARQLQQLVLATRLEAASMRLGGPSIVDANEEFKQAEQKLDELLNGLVREKGLFW